MKLISKTPNGQLMFCPEHNIYHLEFGNTLVNFAPDELKSFGRYIKSIDYNYFLDRNKYSQNRRKLLIHIGSKRIYLALHVHEFFELLELFSGKTRLKLIENTEIINFELALN